MKTLRPTTETCKECGGIKTTVWSDMGYDIKQEHKKDCSVLLALRNKYK